MKKELIKIPRATFDFYKYEENGLTYYEFDATNSHPPEPMINAIYAFTLLKSENDRIVGIFLQEPFPLYERIHLTIAHEVEELDNGDFRVTFKLEE
jgi:hypothetical protein